jgi:photoactive yellow protein
MPFDSPNLLALLEALSDNALDELTFGVIGFDRDTRVCRYNAFESRAAGLSPGDVLGRPLFTEVAQCVNNYLVALRFEDAAERQEPLDDTIPYVLTWRMKPKKVRLRLLASPAHARRYVLLDRA